MTGPLSGLRVVELAGIGPAQYGCMLLADLGADVVRVDRPLPPGHEEPPSDVLSRGRRSIALDLKRPEDLVVGRALADRADVLVDPYRPGVADRLGVGAETLLRTNPGLVYAQMTGWGQSGPLAHAAGHDINYVALTGALWLMGDEDAPPPVPLNLVGDFGAGGMLLAFGIVAALLERERSGRGQVIDVAMVDGVVSMLSSVFALRAGGQWTEGRGRNWLQGAAPWYRPYRTADDRHVTVGPLEDRFYRQLLERLGLTADEFPQWDEATWPALAERLEACFATQPLDHWRTLLEGTDACFAPVLDLDEAAAHPQLAERAAFVRVDGQLQSGPVPRFSRTPGEVGGEAPRPGAHAAEILAELALDGARPLAPASVDSASGA